VYERNPGDPDGIDLMLKTQLPIAVWLVLLPTYIPTLAIGVRRLHDVDRRAYGF
jgi:uncharacterized membrane protein YhaH (DUF805 family)